jgi:diguanylate cyclase (GGDEF)-like protein/PAS domain S-box-containing protein
MKPAKAVRAVDRPAGREREARGPEPVITVLATMPTRAAADEVWALLEKTSSAHYQVIRATCLEDALDRVERGGVDIVLLDLSLPDSTGLSTFQRAHEKTDEVPIVVLAETPRDELAIGAVRQGAHGFVVRSDMDTALLDHTLRLAIERHRAERGLQESERRYFLALQGSNDGFWDWDLVDDTVFFSARWNGLLGYPERGQVASADHWFEQVHPEDLPGLKGILGAHLKDGSRRFECEHRIRGAAGDYLWVLARGQAVRDLQGKPRRMAGTLTDITARKRTEEQLLYHALHDEPTGLANRALFLDRVALSLAKLQRETTDHFAVLYLDLDHFKRVNDTLGHSVGDRLLVGIGRRLRSVLRPGDTLARLGGDEFGILLGSVAEAGVAVQVAGRVQDLLEEPFIIDRHEIVVSASVGIALSATQYSGADEIVHDADIAMYRAKTVGRGHCQVFDPDLHRSAVAVRQLETDLRRGVESEDFLMHYQPVVSLVDGTIVGFEGLIRWNHPTKGLLIPSDFLAAAERSALIVPIGWWALRETCRHAREWQQRLQREPPLWFGINVADKLFMQVDVIDRLRAALTETGLPPEHLRLELTEHLIMHHGDAALVKLTQLRELGVRLTIDDFGLGYSSLNYLQLFQYDSLKIRPSYISHLENISPTLVKTVLVLAGDLGIEVVAEGVETAEQAHQLRQLGCPQAQGFWFSRPVGAAEAAQLMESPPSWWNLEDEDEGTGE